MTAVEPRGGDGGDEELGAVSVGAGVGHGEKARTGVLELEVLIGELGAVDGLAADASAVGEVTALEHEVGDNTVEDGALVVERLAALGGALLAGAQSTEVLNSLGDGLAIEAHHDATCSMRRDKKRKHVSHNGACGAQT